MLMQIAVRLALVDILKSPKTSQFYDINTNEVPGKLSSKNMISSHVKITCYLHKLKDHRCYGYIINRSFRSESETVSLVFFIISRLFI